jgi:ribosomal protein S18 acetylase RimI-like enzyme
MATGSSVRKATLADAPRLAQALASAFQDDPVIAWVFPDQHRRRAVLPAFMEFRLRKLAFPHDQVWMTADGSAAAVWLPPTGRWQLPLPQRLGLLPALVRFLGLRTASVLAGLDRMEQRHPHDPPHWYLFILGTEPAAQGRGLGSALLAEVLTRVDADGMPAYLESSNERNLAFYGRHGFEITSEVAIPGGPRIWPMWREPHPSTDDH